MALSQVLPLLVREDQGVIAMKRYSITPPDIQNWSLTIMYSLVWYIRTSSDATYMETFRLKTAVFAMQAESKFDTLTKVILAKDHKLKVPSEDAAHCTVAML